MSRRGRALALTALALVALMAIAVVAVPWQGLLRRVGEERLAAATGCAVAIGGRVEAAPGRLTEVHVTSIALAPRPGGPPLCQGEVDELDYSVRLWGLRVERIQARGQLDYASERFPLQASLEPREAGTYEFALRGGRPGVLELDARGGFDDVSGLEGLNARVELKARDLSLLGDLLALPLPAAGPVALSGAIRARERSFQAEDVAFDLGKSRITGRVSASLPRRGRPRFDVRLDAESLRLVDIGIRPRPKRIAAAPEGAAGWSDEPFALEPLGLFDAKLVARAAAVEGTAGPLLDEMTLEGELEQGKLSLRHLSVAIDGGRLTGELGVDMGATPPVFWIDAEARGVSLARLLEQLEGSDAYSGALNGDLEWKGSGASPRELAGSLAGELVLAASDGAISTDHASLLTRDFFSVLRPSQQRKADKLNCLVVHLGFDAGVGNVRAWILDLEDLVVVGEGRVDLADRRVDLRFVPSPRNPSPLSTAATIRVTGPILSPRVTSEKSSFAISTSKALLEAVPWLSRSRKTLRELVGAGEQFGRCRELLQQ